MDGRANVRMMSGFAQVNGSALRKIKHLAHPEATERLAIVVENARLMSGSG